jgi:hypothetical protein
MKIVQNDNASLIECVKSWEKQIVNPNPGKLFQEVSNLLFVFISSKRHLCRSEHFYSNSKFSWLKLHILKLRLWTFSNSFEKTAILFSSFSIVNPNPGKLFQEVSDKNKGRKLNEF